MPTIGIRTYVYIPSNCYDLACECHSMRVNLSWNSNNLSLVRWKLMTFEMDRYLPSKSPMYQLYFTMRVEAESTLDTMISAAYQGLIKALRVLNHHKIANPCPEVDTGVFCGVIDSSLLHLPKKLNTFPSGPCYKICPPEAPKSEISIFYL